MAEIQITNADGGVITYQGIRFVVAPELG